MRTVPEPWSYGTAAIAGLLHDAFAVSGLFSILGRVFNLELQSTFIVAVLTVIGFSVHDSIVVFDRVRENLVRRAGEPFEDIVNHSIMQTLTRSLNTSLTVILTLLVVFLFGGMSVRPFVLAILLGITVGVYSSIFFSGMLLVTWRAGELRRLMFFLPQRNITVLGRARSVPAARLPGRGRRGTRTASGNFSGGQRAVRIPCPIRSDVHHLERRAPV